MTETLPSTGNAEGLTDFLGAKDAAAMLCIRPVAKLEIQGPRFSMNTVYHFAEKNQLTQDWRGLGQLQAADLMQGQRWEIPLAHVLVFQRPGSRRRTDPGNCAPAVKAAIDGMVLAGMFVDDDSAHLIGPDFRLGRMLKLPKGTWRLRFDVWVPDPSGDPA